MKSFLEQNLGLHIERTKRSLPLPANKNSRNNNLVIEFIGPSCIGKTTLCNYFIKNYGKSYGKETISKEKLAAYQHKGIDLEGRHDRFLNEKISLLAAIKGISGLNKQKKIGFVTKYVIEDYILAHYLSDTIAALDEHLFSRIYDELPERDEDLGLFLKNRIFVHCTLAPKTHVKYIEKRRKRKFKPTLYRDYEGAELLEASRRQQLKNEKIIRKLAQNGAIILTVDMSKDLTENAQSINKIVETFLSKLD